MFPHKFISTSFAIIEYFTGNKFFDNVIYINKKDYLKIDYTASS